MIKDLALRRAINDKFAGKDTRGKTGKPRNTIMLDDSRIAQEKMQYSLKESSKAYNLVRGIINKAKKKTREKQHK